MEEPLTEMEKVGKVKVRVMRLVEESSPSESEKSTVARIIRAFRNTSAFADDDIDTVDLMYPQPLARIHTTSGLKLEYSLRHQCFLIPLCYPACSDCEDYNRCIVSKITDPDFTTVVEEDNPRTLRLLK